MPRIDLLMPWEPFVFKSVIGIALLAILMVTARGFAGTRPEDPERLERFLACVRRSASANEADAVATGRLFAGLCALFQAEIAYYYRRRVIGRRFSLLVRCFTFGAGTVGVVIPLIVAIEPTRPWLAPYGYLSLGLAAAAYGGNELFGGTRNHIRFVTTQYRLERSLELLALDWQCWQASLNDLRSGAWHRMSGLGRRDRARVMDRGFELLRARVSELHAIISNETSEWATKLEIAEAAYRSNLPATDPKR